MSAVVDTLWAVLNNPNVAYLLNGAGSVYVGGELWSASADESIQPGEKVVVVKRDGLTLRVAKPKRN